MKYYINCYYDILFYYNINDINSSVLPIKYFSDSLYLNPNLYVNKKYIEFINFLGIYIIKKIQNWWKKHYYSPYTKIGKKRLLNSYNNLLNNEFDNNLFNNEFDNNLLNNSKNKRELYNSNYFIIHFNNKEEYDIFNKKYIYKLNKNILGYFLRRFI